MILALLPRRTDAATLTNAVRGRKVADTLPLIGRVRLSGGAEAIIIGHRRTPQLGLPEVLTQRLDTRAQAWVSTALVTPIGKPQLVVITGGLT